MNDSERLAIVRELLHSLPVLHASSAPEPPVTVRGVDLHAIIDVADGVDDGPAGWVNVPCPNTSKERAEWFAFEHSPHHWSDYQEGRVPLRITHWCNGELTDA